MIGRIAIFVAGDENIFLPAVNALLSFCRWNEYLDPFLCVPLKRIASDRVEMCDSLGIALLDIDAIELPFGSSLSEDYKWPVEVYANYALPCVFHARGYRFSIKIDYDTVCVRTIDPMEIVPSDATFSGNSHFYGLNRMLSDQEFFCLTFNLKPFTLQRPGTNVGVLVVNNQRYCQEKVFDRMIHVFSRIQKEYRGSHTNPFFADQGIFNLVHAIWDDEIEKRTLSDRYNRTVHNSAWTPLSRTAVYHFVTKRKPWLGTPSLPSLVRHPSIVLFFHEYQRSVRRSVSRDSRLSALSHPVPSWLLILLTVPAVCEAAFIHFVRRTASLRR